VLHDPDCGPLVNPAVFVIAFLLGTAAVALWVDARFPQLQPSDLRRALIRTGIALAASQVLFTPAWDAAVARGAVLLALFAVAFTCLGYLILSTMCSIRRLQATMRGAS
jgi:hypothetical protein